MWSPGKTQWRALQGTSKEKLPDEGLMRKWESVIASMLSPKWLVWSACEYSVIPNSVYCCCIGLDCPRVLAKNWNCSSFCPCGLTKVCKQHGSPENDPLLAHMERGWASSLLFSTAANMHPLCELWLFFFCLSWLWFVPRKMLSCCKPPSALDPAVVCPCSVTSA